MTVTWVDFTEGKLIFVINFWGSKVTYEKEIPDWLRLKIKGA